jgi:hypothetical protein
MLSRMLFLILASTSVFCQTTTSSSAGQIRSMRQEIDKAFQRHDAKKLTTLVGSDCHFTAPLLIAVSHHHHHQASQHQITSGWPSCHDPEATLQWVARGTARRGRSLKSYFFEASATKESLKSFFSSGAARASRPGI